MVVEGMIEQPDSRRQRLKNLKKLRRQVKGKVPQTCVYGTFFVPLSIKTEDETSSYDSRGTAGGSTCAGGKSPYDHR